MERILTKRTPKTTEALPNGTVKLADVASAAGVALATASRALSNPKRVNAETRERVLEVANRLGYSINIAARSLRSGLSRTIMAVVPRWHSTDIFETLLREIDAELLRSGYSMIVAHLGDDLEADPRAIDLTRGGLVDGLLAIANDVPASGQLSVLSAGLPTVGLLADLGKLGVPSVVSDDRNAVFELTRAMIAAGRRRFMYVGGPKGDYHEPERYAGFRKALAGVEGVAKSLRIEGDRSFEAGVRAAETFLAAKVRPDAAVFYNDRMALSFMDTVIRAGVRIPEDVAVAGFDDIEIAQHVRPSLTTVRQSTDLLGAFGARLLLQIIASNPPASLEPLVVPSRLIRRESF